MFKSMQKKQNHMELMEEIKSIKKLLIKTNSIIADEFDYEEHLIDYMDKLFYVNAGAHPDQIYLVGKLNGGRELHVPLYRS
ncbi:TPA_asm: hypothetical protein GJJ62_12060 [Listeria monocytogenes]|uniref:Uncharacterized protein n=2 Tax=Listeria TaxID=1637 RepID=A0A5K9T111_LISMN|nr:hypothetical protein LM5578_1322 [Listeria monocytogenes 08-5578]ADB71117.1 hypothetical protein LM5923_1275 [Listeria monocytogenes 08-5923]AHF31993.1 hypothetical protein A430_1314 [Listeria monocytogenes serotype 1/2a str. 08-6569]AHF34984.1 putative phage protein [Listeria monocytogenes serotype 1/2a str. 08-6997]AHF37975.1 hypothetical protein A435_1314 [Listeria monocytogenes serotype 1/2a str. 10-0815]AHI69915.1 putative phage protein [Listeria monocytogenes serotype 1/2a str. 01-128